MVDSLRGELPSTLSLDEAHRPAFYMVLSYLGAEGQPRDALVDLVQYM